MNTYKLINTFKSTCIINQTKNQFLKYTTNYLNDKKKYKLLKNNKYKTPKLIKNVGEFAVYLYDDDFINHTLHEELYKEEKYWKNLDKYFDKLRKRIVNAKIMNKDNLCNNDFFTKRIKMLKVNTETLEKSEKHLLNKVITKIKKMDSLYAYISNGDLTDTNITLNYKICDLENAGYNSVLFDLSIFIISIVYGSWIYPKYNENSYSIRPFILDKISPKLVDKQIIFLNKINELINSLPEPIKKELLDNLKYTIIFRLYTPMKYDKMINEDKIMVNTLLNKVYFCNTNVINTLIDALK